MDKSPDVNDQLVSLLTTHQSQLRGYIFASLGDYSSTLDVLQRTNVTLWRKADQYREDSPFLPWAFGVARYEILGFLRDRSRERVVFHSDVVELMSEKAEDEAGLMPDRQQALHHCMRELQESHLKIFSLRYAESKSIAEIAEATSRSIDSIKSLMLRVRRSLRECIDRRLANGG